MFSVAICATKYLVPHQALGAIDVELTISCGIRNICSTNLLATTPFLPISSADGNYGRRDASLNVNEVSPAVNLTQCGNIGFNCRARVVHRGRMVMHPQVFEAVHFGTCRGEGFGEETTYCNVDVIGQLRGGWGLRGWVLGGLGW